MRRKHCEIKDPKEMIRILASTNIGRLATVDAEGYPYITPLNFVFHEGCVYFHCAASPGTWRPCGPWGTSWSATNEEDGE